MIKIFKFILQSVALLIVIIDCISAPPPSSTTTKTTTTTTTTRTTTTTTTTTPTTTTTTTTTYSPSSDPMITSWLKANGSGYGSIVGNVNKIQYSSSYIYISAASIPATYTIGPKWNANPNNATDQKLTFKFPRSRSVPQTKFSTPLGKIGVWTNGVVMYNANDGKSYNNSGVWNRNAYVWEGNSFDGCKGHPDDSGTYHHHVNPVCLYNSTANTTHSPIIGWAFDGYPIYGAFGYSSANNSASSIKRMLTSYRTRNITARTSLASGTTLNSTYYGPTINSTYPLGSYLEDYEYVSGLGDLDEYNGRWCSTPDYPTGTYAYFVTTDSSGTPTYPFIIGPYFYGTPLRDNFGFSSASISESVTVYFSYSS